MVPTTDSWPLTKAGKSDDMPLTDLRRDELDAYRPQVPLPDRSLEVHPDNGHEGGQTHRWVRQPARLAARL